MSIFPKVIPRGKDSLVTLHMHLENNGRKDILGRVVFVVNTPDNEKKIIQKKILVKKLSAIDMYNVFRVTKNFVRGRYRVVGKFCFEDETVFSATRNSDFFDIV